MKYSKIKFYLSYFYFKLRIPFDVKVGWLTVLTAEIIWLLNNVFKTNFNLPNFLKRDYFETIFGKFYVTPDLVSLITVSPAFERLDTDFLDSLIQDSIKKGKVLLVDIGAYFGDYSIRYANKYKKNKNLSIYAFEPGTEYLSESTLDQLTKNIKLNNCKNIKVFKFGIGSRKEKNKIGINVVPLDLVLTKEDFSQFDKVFIKLDIDDFVVDGLKGIQKSTEKFDEVILLVEDFVKPKETFKFLKANNYKFISKSTPYNSFWIKQNA